MQKYEYYLVQHMSDTEVDRFIDKLAADGWRVISLSFVRNDDGSDDYKILFEIPLEITK